MNVNIGTANFLSNLIGVRSRYSKRRLVLVEKKKKRLDFISTAINIYID